MKTRNTKRWLAVILASLAAVILIAAAGGVFLFHHELKTLYSLEKVDDNVLYTMKYDGDYGLDEFLEKGASSDRELVEFVTSRLLKGIPLEFSIPDLGCSTFSAQTEDGDRVFGRNFDLTYSPALFVVTEPEKGWQWQCCVLAMSLQTRIRARRILPPLRPYVLCWIRQPMWMRP